MYGVLFAWMRPIKDAFENRLMSVSLAVTVVNLGIGAVSRIPAENSVPSSDVNKYMDTVLFDILVLGANIQYAWHPYQYLKVWRKNQQWSFSCCLALFLSLASLPGDISGVVGTNIIDR